MKTEIFETGESRAEARRILRCNARLVLSDERHLKARTVDISSSGLCLMADANMPAGTSCQISFEFPIAGMPKRVEARAKVVYSICVGTAGFRIGLQFGEMDGASRTIVNQISS